MTMTVAKRFQHAWATLSWEFRKLRPKEASDYLGRGLDRHVLGDMAGAIDDYGEAFARYTDNKDKSVALLARGNARKDQGDLNGAVVDYGRAIALQPGYAGAYLNRGLAYREMGKAEQALADLQMVRELTADAGWREEAERRIRELKNGTWSPPKFIVP
jgi:tetratricopeptide (TPR) repeat protein